LDLAAEDAIYKLTNEILKTLYNKTMVGGIFVTLRKHLTLWVRYYCQS
jgi:hypothetical protein